VTPYDAAHLYGPPSRYVTLTTPTLSTDTETTPLKYLAYEDFESGYFTALMPGPMGNGVVISPASAYGGSANGVRIPSAAFVAAGAPEFSDTKTLSWQAQIRPYQDGWAMGVRFNHSGSNNTTTTVTHTEGSNSGTNYSSTTGTSESESFNDTPLTSSESFTDSSSLTSGYSTNITDSNGWSQNDTPSSHSFSHTTTTGGPGGTNSNVTTVTTDSENLSHSQTGIDGFDSSTTISSGTRDNRSTNSADGSSTHDEYSDSGVTLTQGHGSTHGTSTNTVTTTNTPDSSNSGSDTSTTTDGNSSSYNTTGSHSSSTTTNPGSSSISHAQSSTHGSSSSHTQTHGTSGSGSTGGSGSTSISDNRTTTTTVGGNDVQEEFGLYYSGGSVYAAKVDFADGIVQQLTNSLPIDTSAYHLAELTAAKTANGCAFRISLDRQVLNGWEEAGAGVVDFTLSGVDADNIAFATSFIGGGVIAGASEDLLDWDPSLNASGYLLSWQQDQIPWRSLDIGNVNTYTHTTPTPAASTVMDPPSGPIAVDYARLRVKLAGGATETRLLPQPTVRTAIAGAADELVSLGRFTLPPGADAELTDEVHQTTIVLEGQMGGTVPEALSSAQLWFMPADEPDSWAGITAAMPGLGGTAVDLKLGTDRFGRSYGRMYDQGSNAFLGFADITGALGAGPGDTLLTVAVEKENANGTYSPDLSLTYQVGTQRVPKWRWLASPGGGF
jgi:hypothetical protein